MKKIFRGILVAAVIFAGAFVFGGSAVSEAGTVCAAGPVKAKEYKISKNKTEYFKKLSVGEHLKLSIKYKGKNISAKKLKFTSLKPSVASVSADGTIVALANGVTDIKVTSVKAKNVGVRIRLTVANKSVRTLFIGDSRTLDLFTAKPGHIFGKVYDGIVVFAYDGANAFDMKNILNRVDMDDYDKIVSWMGANDRGQFERYPSYYNKLLKKHKELVLCTVGYSVEEKLPRGDDYYFGYGIILEYNNKLKAYAKKHNIQVIGVSGAVSKYTNIDETDGLHYFPKPNKRLWKFFVKKIKTKYVLLMFHNEV